MKIRFLNSSANPKLAQAAIELAIFGGIVIFVLGLMVRQAFNANFAQNQSLKIMRLALAESYRTSEAGSPSRNTATILIVEDRITPTAEKFGASSRVPFVLSGSGTHTRELFMPPDFDRDEELPRFDIYINGQHFVFIIANYKTVYELNKPTPLYWNSGLTIHPDWDPQCAYRYNFNSQTNTLDIEYVGCRRFYSVIPNVQNNSQVNKFCCEDTVGTVSGCSNQCDTKNLSADERFDLNRDLNNNPPGDIVPSSMRANFAWQWYLVKGFNQDFSNGTREVNMFIGGQIVTVNMRHPFSVNYGETIKLQTKSSAPKNTLVDVDMDFQEELILDARTDANLSGVLMEVDVLDSQEGDIDMTRDHRSKGPRVGMQDDIQMFSYTKDGTYLLLDEGQLFTADTRRFVRTTQKRDRIDVIQRTVQLSNDTKRFCDWLARSPYPIVDQGLTAVQFPNPVEVCVDDIQTPTNPTPSNCFSQQNIDKTCFSKGGKIIYVRSRLKDLGGKKWVTPLDLTNLP
mgnify:CR=1 FL=1